MKRSIEIMNAIAEKKEKMAELKSEGKIKEAYDMLTEIKDLQKELEIENKLSEPQPGIGMNVETRNSSSALAAFNKALRNMPLTDAEAALVEKVDEDGGYLVPEDQRTQIEELKRSLNSLKQYCKIVPVTTLSGSFPIEVESNGELIDFDEMDDLEEGDIKFGKISWKVKNKGLLIPLSKQLLADEKANLLPYIDRHFAKRAVRTENKAIVTVMKTATQLEGTDYKAITKALNKKLDAAIAADAKIFTNQTGWDYLDSLEDGDGRPLLQPMLGDPTRLMLKGHEIVKLNDSEYAADTGKLEFWVGDLYSFCNFFDRMTLEMAVSEEAGFKNYSVFIRAVERFDVGKTDGAAGIRVIIPDPEATVADDEEDADLGA